MAAKAIQAGIVAFNKSPLEIQQRYLADGEGTQIVLTAEDEESLLRLHVAASTLGCSTSIVIDNGKLMAVGIGPVMREIACALTKDLPRMK